MDVSDSVSGEFYRPISDGDLGSDVHDSGEVEIDAPVERVTESVDEDLTPVVEEIKRVKRPISDKKRAQLEIARARAVEVRKERVRLRKEREMDEMFESRFTNFMKKRQVRFEDEPKVEEPPTPAPTHEPVVHQRPTLVRQNAVHSHLLSSAF